MKLNQSLKCPFTNHCCSVTGGENIAPRDVEQVLELHPDILTAAVVGIPDVRWGETAAAFIDR